MTHSLKTVRALQGGFTIIELMVALILGLLVVAAAGSIFLSNHRVYGSTEAINRIQENQRSAFEMLARDIREAGANPCLRFTSTVTPVQQINAPDAAFWSRFPRGIFAQDGTGAGGADEVTLYSANGTVYNVGQHKKPDDPITVGAPTAALSNGQALMICNTDYAIAFAATGVTSAGTTIGHSTASNCGAGFTPAPDSTKCAATSSGTGYCFWAGTAPTAADVTNCPAGIGTSPAFVTVPIQVTWTVESNSRGGNSLYRTVGANKSEIAEGVTGLDLTYKVGTAAGYVGAGAVTDWSRVTAVRVQMSFEAASGGALSATQVKGTDNNALTRSLDDYILLRNHQDIL